MKKLFPNKLLIFDVETTGLDPSIHACIEIGAVLLDESLTEIKEFSSLVVPWKGSMVLDEALAVSGIRLQELRDAKSLETVVAEFHRMFCTDHVIPLLSGWNVWFDVMFLRSMYHRASTEWPFSHRFLDVQSIAIFCSQFRVTSQEVMIRTLLGESQTHRALNDAKHTAKLLRHFAHDQLPITST